MSLEQLVSTVKLRIGMPLFGLYLMAVPSYSCDEDSDSKEVCTSSTQCRSGRECISGKCDYNPVSDKYSCNNACDRMYQCDGNDWGVYDTKQRCVDDCISEPWTGQLRHCIVDACNPRC